MSDKHGLGTLVNEANELGADSLDLFSLPPIERLLVHGKTIIFHPTSVLTDQGPHEFSMPADNSDFTILPFTTLDGCVEVQKIDGTALTDTEKTTIVNLFPHTLFRQVEVYLNEKLISDITTPTYAYKAYIETHLSHKKAIKETILQDSEFYYKEVVGKEETFATADTDVYPNLQRYKRIKGKKIYFSITPHVDFLQCQRLLLPGCTLKFRFLRNEDSFSLFCPDGGAIAAKIVFKELTMSCRRVTIDPEAVRKIESHLLTTPAIYPVTNAKIKKLLINAGTQSINLSQIIRGPLPRSIIVGFVGSKNADGHLNKNPFLFQHFKNCYFNATLDGEAIVPKVFEPDCATTANPKALREYKWFLNNIGCYDQVSVDITFADFMANSFFYAFDLSPDLCNSFYLHGVENGNFELQLAFKDALAENVNCIVYAAFNEFVMIDNERNVTLVEK